MQRAISRAFFAEQWFHPWGTHRRHEEHTRLTVGLSPELDPLRHCFTNDRFLSALSREQ